MILKTHDLETLYSSYKIYINDKININFSHFIILQLDSIWRAASWALDAWLLIGWHESPRVSAASMYAGRRRGACMVREYYSCTTAVVVHVLVLNLVYTRVPYFSITVYLIDTIVVIWIQQIINYDP